MADYVLTLQFLKELAAFEKSGSARDLKNLDECMAAIVLDPHLPGRVPSFYDPSLPSYLYRSGNMIIQYRTPHPGLVEFLNVFWPRI